MKKTLAFLLAFMLVLSVVTLPASATEATTSIKSTNIDGLDSTINYMYEASSVSASGFELSVCSANYGLSNCIGVVDTETNTIHKYYELFGKSTTANTIQAAYAMGENYQMIIGNELGDTYSGTDATTTGIVVTGQPMKGAFLKKVADPKDATNNVLEYNFGQTGNNSPTGRYKGIIERLSFGSNTQMFTAATDTTAAAKINSGVIAYEWKFYIPENSAKYMTADTSYQYIGGVYGARTGGSTLLKDTTRYESGKLLHKITDSSNKVVNTIEISPDTWHTMKQVIIVDDETLTTSVPMIAVFFDGEFICKVRARDTLRSISGKGLTGSGFFQAGLAPTASSTYADQNINYNVYYDDAKQYWINDNLTVSGINDSYNTFDVENDSVEITYSNHADFDALKEAITVYSDNAVAEDVVVNVTAKDAYTAVLTFEGMNVKNATTYTVVISEFTDVYGITAEGKTFTATTSPEFIATSNPEVFEGFKAGTERAIEFSFTAPLADDVASAFVVKDADGNVKTGWTATLSSNKKVATVSLKELDATGTFPYTISTLEGIRDTNGRTMISVTDVKINKAGKYDIFSDDFTNGFNSSDYKINNGAAGSDIATAAVDVDPADSTKENKVLKMTAQGVTTTTGFNFYLARKPTLYGDSINFTDPESPLYGKKLVLEMDSYIASGYTQYNYAGTFMSFLRSTDSTFREASSFTANYSRTNSKGTSFSIQNSTNGNTKLAKNTYANRLNAGTSLVVTADKWQKFRMIFDQTDTTRHDTHRVYKFNDDGSTMTLASKEYTYVTNVAEDGTITTATTKTAADGANRYPEYVYDFMSERMTNSTYLLFPGEENFKYDTSKEYGTFYGTMFGWNVGTTASTRYIDNLKAYAIDPFKIVSVSSNVNDFIPEKNAKIEIGFNQTLYSDETQLKNNIMLITKDADGYDTDVSSNIKSITINSSKDAVTVELDATSLTDGTSYEIAFGPRFIDEYGQALAVYQSEILVDRTRIYGDYAIDFTVNPYLGFAVSVDNSTISNFYAGADRNVTVKLTQPTVLTQAELVNAFKVTDNNGETVTGWTASLSEDAKTITINLSELDATKAFPYTLVSLDTLVNDEYEAPPAAISVTIEDANGIYTIFDETFENMTENVEWKNNLDSSNWVTSANTGVGENTWRYINSDGNTTNSIMVVDGSEIGRTGNVLKYTSGSDGSTPYVFRNSNADSGINFKSDETYKGKKLVYQADIYFDDFVTTNGNSSALMNFNNKAAVKGEGTFARVDGNGILISSGAWSNNIPHLRRTTINLKNGWHTVTAVVDQTGTNPEISYDNVRYYLDGEPVIVPFYSAESGKDPTYYMSNESQSASNLAPNFGTFYGLAFGSLSDGDSFYLDNLKAYAIDGVAFNVESIEFNKATGVITAKFNSILTDDMLSKITILNADGEAVGGAVKTVGADGKSLVISGIVEPNFELFTEYTLSVDGLFRDLYFNEFNCYNNYTYDFITARSGELSVANEPVATITETGLTTTVEICNRTNISTEFVMAVAVYDGYKLLGVQSMPIELGAMSSVSKDFALTGDYSTATNVKIHFWDSISGMNAMSIPELVALSE